MTKLPSDSELSKLYALGHTDAQVAEEYGVTRQAVSYRWKAMGIVRRPIIKQVSDLLSEVWDDSPARNSGKHHNQSPVQSLRAYLRLQMGDDSLSDRQMTTALAFEKRLRRRNEVVEYDPVVGYHYVQRLRQDDGFIVRWPADRPKPVGKAADIWRLPKEPRQPNGSRPGGDAATG